MNSHDKGVAYSLATPEQKRDIQKRANWIVDVTDAIQNGFKAEPDLSPCHLPLLSDDALERVFNESEKWRDKTRERELETLADRMRSDNERISGHYVNLRQILGALDVPHGFRAIDGNPTNVAWTEQKARELVKKADASDRNHKAATDAEQRVELLGRYVKACDDKRIPYNWNVFKMTIGLLRETVYSHEGQDRLTNCDIDPDIVNDFAERKEQEAEQSLRLHSQRADATRKLIQEYKGGRIHHEVAEYLLDALLGREDWTAWDRGYPPKDLTITIGTLLEVELTNGDRVNLTVPAIEWSEVKAYRRAK